MINNVSICQYDWYYDEYVKPIKDKIDSFLESASNPNFMLLEHEVERACEANEIPKIIHFCFINYKNLPNEYYVLLNTWLLHLLEDYLFVNWTPDNLQFKNLFMETALKNKLWAYYADNIRVLVCYEYGGFYMDCDVVVHKSFDDLIKLPYIFDLEFNNTKSSNVIDAGVFGVRYHNNFMKLLVDFYNNIEPQEFNNLDIQKFIDKFLAPKIWNNVLAQYNYLYLFLDKNKKDISVFFDINLQQYYNLNNTIIVGNGKFLSKPNTDFPNRYINAFFTKDLEYYNEKCAYTSHQMLSSYNVTHFAENLLLTVFIITNNTSINYINKIIAIGNNNYIGYIGILIPYTFDENKLTNITSKIKNKFFIYKFNDNLFNDNANLLITSEILYSTLLKYMYICIIKENTILNYFIYIYHYILNNIINIKNIKHIEWIGTFNKYDLYIRKTSACTNICHKYPNYNNIEDITYFLKEHKNELYIKPF